MKDEAPVLTSAEAFGAIVCMFTEVCMYGLIIAWGADCVFFRIMDVMLKAEQKVSCRWFAHVMFFRVGISANQ